MNKFSFQPLSENDFAMLYDWLNRPHVADRWDGQMTLADVENRYRKHINSNCVFPFIVKIENRPIGFIQSYNANLVGDGWWENEPPGTWGVDQYIAEFDLLNKGLGSSFIREFTDRLLERPGVNRVITDPAPDNTRAIRCYEKAGFKKISVTNTPDGPAMIMEKLRLNF